MVVPRARCLFLCGIGSGLGPRHVSSPSSPAAGELVFLAFVGSVDPAVISFLALTVGSNLVLTGNSRFLLQLGRQHALVFRNLFSSN